MQTETELRKRKRLKGCMHGVLPDARNCPRCREAVRQFWKLWDDEQRRAGREVPRCKAPPL
jgi:hypothetical protein